MASRSPNSKQSLSKSRTIGGSAVSSSSELPFILFCHSCYTGGLSLVLSILSRLLLFDGICVLLLPTRVDCRNSNRNIRFGILTDNMMFFSIMDGFRAKPKTQNNARKNIHGWKNLNGRFENILVWRADSLFVRTKISLKYHSCGCCWIFRDWTAVMLLHILALRKFEKLESCPIFCVQVVCKWKLFLYSGMEF